MPKITDLPKRRASKEELEEDKRKGQRYIGRREKVASIGGLTSGEAARLLVPEEAAGMAELQAQEIAAGRRAQAAATIKELIQTPTEEPTQKQAEKAGRLSALQIAKNLIFGNVLEVNPFTGERAIDPITGEPVETQLGIAPLGVPAPVVPSGIGLGGQATTAATAAATAEAVGVASGFSSSLLKLAAGVGGVVGVSRLVSTPDRRIRSADGALQQIRETISLIPDGVSAGGSPEQALSDLDDLEAEVLKLETAIRTNAEWSIEDRLNPDFTRPMLIRAEKLKTAIANARRKVLNFAAQRELQPSPAQQLVEQVTGEQALTEETA